MTVAELIAALLRLPDQSAPVCLPPLAEGDSWDDYLVDDQEVVGTSRWDGMHLTENGRAMVTGPYIRLDTKGH